MAIYICITIFLTAIIVHGLTRAFIKPVEEVTEVREIIRYEREAIDFANQIIIEQGRYSMRKMPATEANELEIAYRRVVEQMLFSIPKEMIEVKVFENYGPEGPEKIMKVKLIVMPPRKI